MIFKRLTYLAVCLLVLLNVVSTMGGNNEDYKYYNSQGNNSLCLSLRNKRLTDCCKQDDDMQQIYVHKTGRLTGIFHTKNYKRVLCYDKLKMKFKLYKRKKSDLTKCRHQRRHERRHGRRSYKGCRLTSADMQKLKTEGCELYENVAFGYTYISAQKKSLYLGIRRGRVQRHKIRRRKKWMNNTIEIREPKDVAQRFMSISEKQITAIIERRGVC